MSTFRILICVTIILSITIWWCNICYNQLLDNRVVEVHNYYVNLINKYNCYTPIYDSNGYIVQLKFKE
jgi:hypothetical protein